MIDQRDAQAIDAAKLYYVSGLSQLEVAQRLGVSRPTVSKLLNRARDKGYVTITLHDPRERGDELIAQLKEAFGLIDARVVRPARADVHELLAELGNAGATLLEELVTDNVSIGISWGDTMAAVADHLRTVPLTGVTVVQLKGGHSHTPRATHDMDTLTRFARAFDARMAMLPLPVILDSVEAKEMIVRDRHIASVLEAGRNTDIAVFTAGEVARESILLNLGYLDELEQQEILDNAVGDVCSRFYTADGRVAAPEVNDRTVGISLGDLSRRPVRVLVAGGVAKAQAIAAALRMGLANYLVIDHDTAERVLDIAAAEN